MNGVNILPAYSVSGIGKLHFICLDITQGTHLYTFFFLYKPLKASVKNNMEGLPVEVLEIVFHPLSRKKDSIENCFNTNSKWRHIIENMFVNRSILYSFITRIIREYISLWIAIIYLPWLAMQQNKQFQILLHIIYNTKICSCIWLRVFALVFGICHSFANWRPFSYIRYLRKDFSPINFPWSFIKSR